MTTFRQLLSGFEETAKTRAAQGRHFERFCEAFFRLAAMTNILEGPPLRAAALLLASALVAAVVIVT